MTAGLPGTGIGCLFYLVSALCMPFIELYMTCRGRSSRQRWKLVATQLGLALGIAGGFWVTGWCLGQLLPAKQVLSLQGTGEALNVIAITSFLMSGAVLVCVLIGIEVLSMIARWRDKRRAALAVSLSLS
jgi:hypothetical protein